MENSGRCALRGSCGTKSGYGKELPCPYDGPPSQPESDEDRAALIAACGEQFAEGPVCCTPEQVQTLHQNLKLAENFISSCPACRNNFRSFFCSFTCSPSQGEFVNVTDTQISYSEEVAVKSVDFFVGNTHSSGFFDSCKNVQFGVANDFAMKFIGNGAKDASTFLQFLGHEEPFQGSPFQINFPSEVPEAYTAYDPVPRNCADNELASRCTCIDCPDVCQALPPVDPPSAGPSCRIGSVSCLSFALANIYAGLVVIVVVAYSIRLGLKQRRDKKYERIDVAGEDPSDNPLSPRSHSRSLVGATSLHYTIDREESLGDQSGDSRRLGRGASLLDPIETIQPRQYRLNTFLRRTFYRLGLFCARYTWLTFAAVFAVMGLLNIGWKYFEIETDPVRLWVSPTSESKLQKEFFDSHFGPFYRIEQMFVTVAPSAESDTETPDVPILSWEHLKWWFDVENEIRALRSPSGTILSDICFKPTGEGGPCVVQSITGWFGDKPGQYEDSWRDRISQCSKSPTECLPEFMQPLPPQNVLGGLPPGSEDWLEARALVIIFLVNDSQDSDVQEVAMEWERTLRQHLLRLSDNAPSQAGLNVHFSTGVSLEEELNKSTNMDVKIVVLSYLAMFFYVALTLGNRASEPREQTLVKSLYVWAIQLPTYFRNSLSTSSTTAYADTPPRLLPRIPRNMFVNSKFTLGLFGIAMVILSVSTSVGFFSLTGVKVTLIIAEVIPFLVLAVGVDNVFILVHELDRQNALHGPNASASTQPFGVSTISSATTNNAGANGNTLRPSPYASSSHEDGGDAVSMPIHFTAEERIARSLAKMGPSILLSSLTETTAFALGALVPMPAVRNFALYAAGSVLINAILQVTVFVSALTLDLLRIEANRIDCFPCIKVPGRIALPEGIPVAPNTGTLARFMRRRFAPFILKPVVKGFVLLLFAGIFVGSVISIQHIRLGLDQRLALPSESYLIPYFDALDSYLDVGPPVYFVATDVNVSSRAGQRHLCGRFTTCESLSLTNVLEAERKREESSFISQPTSSWIDDFLNWLDPLKSSCCRVRRRNPDQFCGTRESDRICRPCLDGREPPWNITMEGFPEDGEFGMYLQQWLKAPSNEDCPLGGQAGYSAALAFEDGTTEVSASHFRTFHSPLKSQADFINSFAAAHRIADSISESTGATVFPYSIHYVYFEQYAYIVAITQELLGLGLAAVLIINSLMLGSWRTGSIVTGVVALTVVTVMGVMGLWDIDLNAISLVNLVISLGIAVEFCAHVARAFMGAGTGLPVDHLSGQKERDERMWTALVDVGPSVLSGITFTKLIGISVLALTRSQLLKTYYFRMWLSLIISGALHGLVLLPVVLSLAGGPGYALEDADEEWMSSSIRRRDYEYTPFLADDETSSQND